MYEEQMSAAERIYWGESAFATATREAKTATQIKELEAKNAQLEKQLALACKDNSLLVKQVVGQRKNIQLLQTALAEYRDVVDFLKKWIQKEPKRAKSYEEDVSDLHFRKTAPEAIAAFPNPNAPHSSLRGQLEIENTE